MSDAETASLGAARARATAARAELHAAIDGAMGWLSPSRLKAEMSDAANHRIDGMKTAVRQSVHTHPLVAWPVLALLSAAVAYLLRRPAKAAATAVSRAARSVKHQFSARK